MLTLPPEIKAQAGAQVATRPLLLLDVWADRGAEGILDSASDWTGSADPNKGSDSQVDFTSLPGSAILAAGSTVNASYTSGPYLLSEITARLNRGETSAYSSIYSTGFNVASTQTVDEVIVRLAAASVYRLAHDYAIYLYSAVDTATVRAWISDASGNLVGQVGSAAMTPVTGGLRLNWLNVEENLTVTGLNAYVAAHLDYTLNFEIFITGTVISWPGEWIELRTTLYGYIQGATKTRWRLGDFNAGGKEAFQATGSLLRVIDVGAVPTDSGVVSITDTVPGIGGTDPTSLTITGEYSDTGIGGPWTAYGSLADGSAVPAHQFWRITAAITSNSTADRTPTLDMVKISYRGAPTTFATRPDIQHGVEYAISGLSTVSSTTSQISAKAQGAMIGEVNALIADMPEFREIMNTDADRLALKGVDVRVRAGYEAITDTVTTSGELLYPIPMALPWVPESQGDTTVTVPITFDLADGRIQNIKYSKNAFTAVIQDYLQFAEVSVPNVAVASSWSSIVYTTEHLSDIALDLLANQLNLRTSHIDQGSLEDVKTAFPSRTCSRTITKPIKVLESLGEIAFLLESQWVRKGGKLALIKEPALSAPSIERITPDDIMQNSLSWSYGWDMLKNAIATFTGYTGDGSNDNEEFGTGEAHIDSTSVADLGQTFLEVAHDKWGIPAAQIQAMNTNYVDRLKLGRQKVSFTASFRLIHLEPGDRVSIQSSQIPTSSFEAMVVRKDFDWFKQTLKMTVMEVF